MNSNYKSSLVEFNLKNLKFYKKAFKPQEDLDRSKVALGFASFLYSKLLGQLTDQKGAIGAYFVKALNANYSEYLKKKKISSNPDAFSLKDFKFPYLGLMFYQQSPETIVDAEEILMANFSNILTKFVVPQRPMKPFSFYNYYSLFSPEDIKNVTLADIKKIIKPTISPKYNGGKVDLTTVFISNYLQGTLAKEFDLAKKDIQAAFDSDKKAKDEKPVEPKKEAPKPVKKEEPEPEATGKPGSNSKGKEKEFYDNLDKTYSQMKDENPPRTLKVK